MNKLVRDGKVAVLISGDYGAGWSTWNPDFPGLLFDPTIVEMVLEFEKNSKIQAAVGDYEELYTRYYQEVETYVRDTYDRVYTGGISSLTVEWVPVGERFLVKEYDGAETLSLERDYKWLTA